MRFFQRLAHVFHSFNELVNHSHLLRNVYSLRAMLNTLTATYAVIGLSETWNAAVIAYEEGSPLLEIFRIFTVSGHVAFLYALVVMGEDGWNIDAVRTWHAVVALVAWYGLEVVYVLRYFH